MCVWEARRAHIPYNNTYQNQMSNMFTRFYFFSFCFVSADPFLFIYFYVYKTRSSELSMYIMIVKSSIYFLAFALFLSFIHSFVVSFFSVLCCVVLKFIFMHAIIIYRKVFCCHTLSRFICQTCIFTLSVCFCLTMLLTFIRSFVHSFVTFRGAFCNISA